MAHAGSLYRLSHARPEGGAIWTHLPYGPFADPGAFEQWLAEGRPPRGPAAREQDQDRGRPGRRLPNALNVSFVGHVGAEILAPARGRRSVDRVAPSRADRAVARAARDG
jgi:hypothetical protein